MKNGHIISAFVGGTFFAISEAALTASLGLASIPVSCIVAGVAYGAGTLIFSDKKETVTDDKTFYDILNDAKKQNAQIYSFINKVEDKELINNVKEIHDTVTKIINTISKEPKKLALAEKFLNYYLPVTVKILTKYDEIENQRLTTADSKAFMDSAESMVARISESFKIQLSRLYQSDMMDTDAEMKVFDNMLKSDGYTDIKDFKIEK